MMHERVLHERSSFVTLTYDDAHVPKDFGLNHRDWQLFAKRLRKEQKFRFFMCGEYGERFKRPHFHAILFGVGFDDRVYCGTSDSGAQQFTSERLSRLWQNGDSKVGDVSLESCQYVAGYTAKKVTGRNADYAYERVDSETGEAYMVRPEYAAMSLKPAIGKRYVDKYAHDLAVHNGVVSRGGVRDSLPRYYRELLYARDDALELMTHMIAHECEHPFDKEKDGSVERLAAQERVALARHRLFKRYVE